MDYEARRAYAALRRLSPEQRLLVGLELVNAEAYGLAETYLSPEQNWEPTTRIGPPLGVLWTRVWLATLAAKELLTNPDTNKAITEAERLMDSVDRKFSDGRLFWESAVERAREALWG